MVIYIDVLLLTNFIISYFLLIAASVLSGYTYNRKRIVVSSAVGAISCLYIFYAGENIFFDITFKLVSIFLCWAIAYGISDIKKNLIQGMWFVLVNMTLTGAVAFLADETMHIYSKNMFFYLNINPVILVAASAVIYFIITIFAFIKEKFTPGSVYTADIFFKDFSIKNIQLFYDSGFKVKDIVSNKDVVMLGFIKVKDILPNKHADNISKFFAGEYEKIDCKYFPVFFSTIQEQSMSPAIKAEYMIIENKRIENLLIAFVNNELSENVTGIFGNDIKKLL